MDLYLWLKAAHIIAVVAWMAGLFYLPRLMVYHCDAENGSVQSETFKVMERRLLKAIMTPAMLAVWVLGGLLAFTPGIVDWGSFNWFYVKLALVVALSGYQGLLSRYVADFALDRNTLSPRFFRILNEVPTIILVAVVILVVVKPF